MANKSVEKVDSRAQDLSYQIQDYRDKDNFDVIELDHYDMILGKKWLKKVNPIIDWKKNTLTIRQGKEEIILREDKEDKEESPSIEVISNMQMKRVAQKNKDPIFLCIIRNSDIDLQVQNLICG